MKTTALPGPTARPVSRRNKVQRPAGEPVAARVRRVTSPDPETLALARKALEVRVAQRCPGSLTLNERARKAFPGGVTHDNRYVNAPALFVKTARGARKTDVDGNSYIDYWMGHGALLLGHGRREVVEAVHLAAQEMLHPGACHEREVLWAERVRALVPSAECVRFTASGSEATALAVRLARALTGKETIIKFEGHFHGWLDHAVPGVDVPFEEPWSQGVPEAVRALTVVLPANDLDLLRNTLSRRGDVAAVIVEPTGGAGGAAPVTPEFLEGLRELCTRYGAKLIFDEVITGFRLAPGGAQERFGIYPDLTCLAKVLAGGMPGGAVCGPHESFAPMRFSGDAAKDRLSRVAQYGTFNAAPACAAAGTATLRLIENGEPCRLAEAAADTLRRRLNDLFRHEGAAFAAYGFSSSLHLFTADPAAARLLRDGEIRAIQIKAATLKKKGALDAILRRALLLEGVDLPPGRQAWLSAVHGEDCLEETVQAFGRALRTLRELGCV